VQDQQLSQLFQQTTTTYATDDQNYSTVLVLINKQGQPLVPKPSKAYVPPAPTSKYQMVLATSYTSGADGTKSFIVTDTNWNPITGDYSILQIIIEIKPLLAAQYTFNPVTAALTLLEGESIDKSQTAYVFYTITVNA
jgi:hypothetical protein